MQRIFGCPLRGGRKPETRFFPVFMLFSTVLLGCVALSIDSASAAIYYTIKASAGTNGKISPSGTVRVRKRTSKKFIMLPATGYAVADVLVNGKSVGAVTSYTFPKISANHTISVSFGRSSFTVTALVQGSGTIAPSGSVTVGGGQNLSFTITPQAGSSIGDVLVDGTSVGAVSNYTFTKVTTNHTIVASFVSTQKDVTIGWDPVTGLSVAGYRVYIGTESRKYTQKVDVGNVTTYTMKGLTIGQTYYVAATSYDSTGKESPYSDEIGFTVQTLGVLQPEGDTAEKAPLDTITPGIGAAKGISGPKTSSGADVLREPVRHEKNLVLAGFGPFPPSGGWIDVMPANRESGASDTRPFRINWPDYNKAGGEGRVATGDIDGDGKMEVVIGLGPLPGQDGIPGGFFEVLDDDHTHIAWGRISWPDYNTFNGETRPACGDLDGDGKDEIIVGLGAGSKGRFEIFDFRDGQVQHRAWASIGWRDYNSVNGETRPAAGDIDGDGKAEILVGLASVPGNSSVPSGLFAVLDDDYRHLGWGKIKWTDYNRVRGESWPAAGDLNGDDKDEIVIGLGPGGSGRFEIFDYDALTGELKHLAWRQISWNDYRKIAGETRPVVGNLDEDGSREILVGYGKMGGGYMELFDDAFSEYMPFGTVQSDLLRAYNEKNGEIRPAIQTR